MKLPGPEKPSEKQSWTFAKKLTFRLFEKPLFSFWGDWDPFVLDVIFLLENNSIEAGAEDLNGRLVELLGENIRIKIAFIFNEGRPPPQFPGEDDLRSLEKDQIPLLHMLPIAFEDMGIRGGASL